MVAKWPKFTVGRNCMRETFQVYLVPEKEATQIPVTPYIATQLKRYKGCGIVLVKVEELDESS